MLSSSCYREIDQSHGRPGYDSLHHFPYAAAVINEALRLYPPATMLSRVATEDVQASKFAPFSGSLAAVLGCQTACKPVLPDQFTLLPFGTCMMSRTYCRSSSKLKLHPFLVIPHLCIATQVCERACLSQQVHQHPLLQALIKLI